MNKLQIQELQTLVTEAQDSEKRAWEMFNEVVDIANEYTNDSAVNYKQQFKLAIGLAFFVAILGITIGVML